MTIGKTHPSLVIDDVITIQKSCGRRTARETRLTLVFEHVDFDLESFMQQNQPINLNQAKERGSNIFMISEK